MNTGSNGAQFACVLNNYTGIAVTSSVATLSVVDPNAANVAAYRTAITGEASSGATTPLTTTQARL